MKTRNIRLIVTMITLAAAVTVTSIPAGAQRRGSRDRNTKNERITKPKSAVKSNKATQRTRPTSRNNSKQVNKATVTRNRVDIARTPQKAVRSSRYRSSGRNSTATQRAQNNTRRESVVKANPAKRNSNITRGSERPRRENPVLNNRNNNRIDRNRPTPDYKGSNRYWHEKFRADNFRNRDNRNFRHWNRDWEHYRWNDRSWHNYYNRYRPYSYLYHKHYYRHPRLGHVIRRFLTRPVVFVFNHIPYYCYDGYFFTYHRGVGYILSDLPYGVVFPELPYGYETVYINGYLYFRIGNLFFEYVWNGYRLVYYPERFYAYRY